MTTEQSTCDFETMGATTEAHARFKPFVGTFKAEVTLWMGPGDPHVSTGVMTNQLELGGRFLHQIYKGDATDGPFPDFEGRGYWGYNTVAGKYEGLWLDTAATFFQTETGDVDSTGKVWTMWGEVPNPQADGMMKKKSIISVVDSDHHTMEMYFVQPDGQEFKGMEIKYERA
ncbi:MAG: DUF1579 family protein [Planctomycetota bacterium]|jgi:hypothetical protein